MSKIKLLFKNITIYRWNKISVDKQLSLLTINRQYFGAYIGLITHSKYLTILIKITFSK